MTTNTAARTASAPRLRGCPPGCDGEHDVDREGSFFHRGPLAVATVPESSVGRVFKDKAPEGPRLTAHLVVPDGPEMVDEPATVTVDAGDLFGPYAELNLEETDQFLRDLKTFTAHVQQMRDHLAAMKEQQS